MPIVKLFSTPDPQDKKVIATSDVVNFWPRLGNDARLAWVQRPGFAIATSGWTGWPPGGGGGGGGGTDYCVPDYYPWKYWNFPITPPAEKVWTSNVDNTLYSPLLHIDGDTLGPVTRMYNLYISSFSTVSPSKKWTIRIVYHTESAANFEVRLINTSNSEDVITLQNSASSKEVHINKTGLSLIKIWNTGIQAVVQNPPPVNLDDSQVWIECFKAFENDFGSEQEAVGIYDS